MMDLSKEMMGTNMNKTTLAVHFICAVAVAILLGCSNQPSNIRAIMAKAKASEKKDNNINFYGFFTGMGSAEARMLAQ